MHLLLIARTGGCRSYVASVASYTNRPTTTPLSPRCDFSDVTSCHRRSCLAIPRSVPSTLPTSPSATSTSGIHTASQRSSVPTLRPLPAHHVSLLANPKGGPIDLRPPASITTTHDTPESSAGAGAHRFPSQQEVLRRCWIAWWSQSEGWGGCKDGCSGTDASFELGCCRGESTSSCCNSPIVDSSLVKHKEEEDLS
jgi:hypothetical protein